MAESVQSRLIREVLEAGRCVGCGACVGLCPHFRFRDGLVVATDECTLTEGRCANLCPRLVDDPVELYVDLGLAAPNGEDPGPIIEIVQAKAAVPAAGVQYGGVVTALVSLMLSIGYVRGAALAAYRGRDCPQGFLARTPLEAVTAAGSNFAGSASLEAFHRGVSQDGLWPLAVVGLPCQVQALARLKASDLSETAPARHALRFVLGLFCTANLAWRDLRSWLKDEGLPLNWTRTDVPPPPAEKFIVETDEERRELPLEGFRSRMMPGCGECIDLTAELADISVGAAENRPGWNTVIIRTETGRKIWTEALEQGLLVAEEMPAEALAHLRWAVANKRRRKKVT
jgi:coenzyme F420 hydrogenase subunit beta